MLLTKIYPFLLYETSYSRSLRRNTLCALVRVLNGVCCVRVTATSKHHAEYSFIPINEYAMCVLRLEFCLFNGALSDRSTLSSTADTVCAVSTHFLSRLSGRGDCVRRAWREKWAGWGGGVDVSVVGYLMFWIVFAWKIMIISIYRIRSSIDSEKLSAENAKIDKYLQFMVHASFDDTKGWQWTWQRLAIRTFRLWRMNKCYAFT